MSDNKMNDPNWNAISTMLKTRYEKASMADRWRMLIRFFAGAGYDWGKENLYGSDCSGLVCAPLYILGYNIRVSADFLYNNIFLKKVTKYADRDKIMAVFYINESGKCTHVAPVLENYIVMNAEPIIQEKTARTVRLYFQARGYTAIWRELDFRAVENISLEGKYVYGLDPELELMREAMA